MPDITLRGGPGTRIDAEIEVRRSRFLTRLVRVEREADARAVIEQARREHWDARHHCSAFVLGAASAPGQVRRSNDDGEPAGTAGGPMLEVLTGRGLVDVVVVVTRYFGGVLLGTGGLARAYSDAVSAAVDEAARSGALVERVRLERFAVALAHADAGRVEAELRARGVRVLGVDYGARAVLTLSPGAGLGSGERELATLVAQATAGGATLEPAGHEWADQPLTSA